MIAPTDLRCKRATTAVSQFVGHPKSPRPGETGRHRIVSGIIIPPNFRPATALLDCEKTISALARSFRHRIPQPPAPRGCQDRAYSQCSYPHTGPTRVGPFSFWPANHWQAVFLLIPAQRCVIASPQKPAADLQTRRQLPGLCGWRWQIRHDAAIAAPVRRNPAANPHGQRLRKHTAREIPSEATYTPRPASGPACRGCHPGYRRRRHRCPRGKCFPAARSSCRHCRSSRRPSARCAPRCGR